MKSRILEEIKSLRGYSLILGLRDAPKNRLSIDLLRQGLISGIPKVTVPVAFIISIMEIESWFLSEHTHFARIHQDLSPALIHDRLGFNPEPEDMSNRETPAKDLNSAYGLVGKQYHKGSGSRQTIYALDMARIAYDLPIPDLKQLIQFIECFLTN